jgi:hypothetical protein
MSHLIGWFVTFLISSTYVTAACERDDEHRLVVAVAEDVDVIGAVNLGRG